MKKTITVDFFSDSKKWPRRMPKIKKISKRTINTMISYFDKNYFTNLNLILSDKKRLKKLNEKFKNKSQDTDVLTFVSKISNKDLGKLLNCDIFFSIDTIENYIKNKNI
ncbi:rRNA maturation RNAse YbeY, partial [Pelagibacteraceae bacterium]|nr:rRNA maturation RNAse YbeY [Pelagibacteraceae bacterium]